MAAALVDSAGRLHAQQSRPTEAGRGIESVTGRLVELLTDVAQAITPDQPLGCGLATPGLVDSPAGVIRYAANIAGATDYPLAQRLQQALSLPVAIDNDIRLHALGEQSAGAARGLRDFFFVAVGTGVGGAFYVNGRPYAGAHGSAGEIGHVTIDEGPTAPMCHCGRRGCLETIAAGPAMTSYFRQQAAEAGLRLALENPELPDIAAWLDRPDHLGDIARATLQRGAHALGLGLAMAITLLDPERVILSGGVAHLGTPWLAAVQQSAADHLLPQARSIPIELGQLGGKAAIIGAAALIRQRLADL